MKKNKVCEAIEMERLPLPIILRETSCPDIQSLVQCVLSSAFFMVKVFQITSHYVPGNKLDAHITRSTTTHKNDINQDRILAGKGGRMLIL